MSDKANSRRKQIKDKIASSEADLAITTPAPADIDAEAPSTARRAAVFVGDHPGFVIAGGLAIGLVAGALIPRSKRQQVTGRAAALAAAASELGLAFGQQALERANEAGKEGRARLHDIGGTLGEKASEARSRAEDASAALRDAGIQLAKKAFDLAASARR